jgi:hypothetical protein
VSKGNEVTGKWKKLREPIKGFIINMFLKDLADLAVVLVKLVGHKSEETRFLTRASSFLNSMAFENNTDTLSRNVVKKFTYVITQKSKELNNIAPKDRNLA